MKKIILKKSLVILAFSTLFSFCVNKEIIITADFIATNNITNITTTTATSGVTIHNPNSLDIADAGLVLSITDSLPFIYYYYNGYYGNPISDTPNLSRNYLIDLSTTISPLLSPVYPTYYGTNVITINNNGNLSGRYTLNLTNLNSNTKYYVRSFIIHNGVILYGYTKTFTTSSPPSLPTTLSLANLASNMILVPGGTSSYTTLGCTPKQLETNADGFICNAGSPNTQRVNLSSYKICQFEVTQQLWIDVMGTNPSNFTGDLQSPVEQVSWNDCVAFIIRLNELTRGTYRLPTEAEWEYAARGGNNDSYFYSGSDNVDLVAWNATNSGSKTQIVGTKNANQLKLNDMSGNVAEWCSDWFGNYANNPILNPTGPISGTYRVFRGGSWNSSLSENRVSYRNYAAPDNKSSNLGLRLVSAP